jgi:hypothetical protein
MCIGLALLARAYAGVGRFPEARLALDEAQAYADAWHTAQPAELNALIRLAIVHETRGDVAVLAGAADEARTAYHRALEVWSQWPNAAPDEYPARQRARVERSLANLR